MITIAFKDAERAVVTLELSETEAETIIEMTRSGALSRRANYPKAYERWTQAEDAHLAMRSRNGSTVDDLALVFGREPKAIRSRLRKLGL
jgi:hypothetical protein